MTFMTDTQKAPPTWGDAFCALGNSGNPPPTTEQTLQRGNSRSGLSGRIESHWLPAHWSTPLLSLWTSS